MEVPPARQLREWALVGAAFAVVATVAALWLGLDRRPPEWDHANHLERVVLCAQDMARGDVGAILERSTFYPPLVMCTAAIAYRLAPSDIAAAQAVILAFLGLGMASVYVLARPFAGGSGGVVAALLFGSAPFVVFSSLRFQLDLPLASVVALMLVLLLRSDGFSRAGWSVAVGIALGLGMLTKPPFAVYVLAPLVLVAAKVRTWNALFNFILAVLIGSALAVPWYGPRLFGIAAQIGARSFKQAAESGHADPLTAEGLLFYPTWFVPQFGLLAVLFLAVGLIVAVRCHRWFLLTTLLVPFSVFEMLQNKNLRYTLPLLPVAAALGGMGFNTLRGRARAMAGAMVPLAAAVQIGATAFGVPHGLTVPLLGTPLVPETPPMRDEWHHREIIALIAHGARGVPATVSVVPNYAFFSASNFRYYALRDGLPLRWARAWDGEPVGIEYMILKTGDQGPAWTAEKPRRIAERFATDQPLARVFPVIGEFPLPDGSTATVRARRIADGPAVALKTFAREVEQAIQRRLADVARDVEGLKIRVAHDQGIREGRLPRVEIDASAATVGELWRRKPALLRIHDVHIVVDDALVNPFSVHADSRLDPLDARRVRLERATVFAADFAAFLHDLKEFKNASVELGREAIAITFRQPGPDVTAHVRILPARDRPFALAADVVLVGGVRVPQRLANWVIRNYDPSLGLAARTPVRVDVGRVEITPDAIHISANP